MGQQQLLLLVLGIVIVGLAVVVGIQAFGENQKKANADAITNDAIRIASDAQAWALKPTAFGGGNGSFGAAYTAGAAVPATSVGLSKLGYEVTTLEYRNLNGNYSLNVSAAGSAPGVTPVTTGSVTIRGCNLSNKNTVTSIVSGTGPANIATTVAANSGSTCAAI